MVSVTLSLIEQAKKREIPGTHKVKLLKETMNNTDITDDKDNLVTTSFSELHRSDGSGSENGTEKFNDSIPWYINEKQLNDKQSNRLESTQVYTPVKYGSSNCKNWRTAHMESFESNKEFIGSDCESRLSLFSQSKDDYNEEEEDWGERPTGERWPPLGAPNDDEDDRSICSFEELGRSRSEVSRLKELEDEQEQLNCSLMSLTSHFAQVQFRLKQITLADPEEKERLLEELEDFADRGIPDFRAIQHTREAANKSTFDQNFTEQKELIEQLKEQLDELEQYAYSAGEAGLPQTVLMNKQKVVIDQLKGKLPLNLDDLDRLSAEDLRTQVDECIRELINPLKMKEQLVSQLQTQIGDLERFIDFLQDDGQKLPDGALSPSKCKCGGHSPSFPTSKGDGASKSSRPNVKSEGFKRSASKEKQLHDDTANLVDRAALLLNMLKFAQLGCGSAASTSDGFKPNATKKGNHWGDVRANLEVAISSLVDYISVASSTGTSSDSDLTSAVTSTSNVSPQRVTLCVRKQFVPALRDLLHHGLVSTNSSRSLVSAWSCFPDRSARVSGKLLHAWDLVLEYYHLKKGDHYNTTPARRLSQSFNLQLSNNTSEGGVGHKGALLVAVGNILSSHTPLKRSPDSHFKAFVSEALNQRRLVVWLRLILRYHPLIDKYYQPWSYVIQTGFDDALKSMEGLQQHQFNLPVDLAVRSLKNIADAF